MKRLLYIPSWSEPTFQLLLKNDCQKHRLAVVPGPVRLGTRRRSHWSGEQRSLTLDTGSTHSQEDSSHAPADRRAASSSQHGHSTLCAVTKPHVGEHGGVRVLDCKEVEATGFVPSTLRYLTGVGTAVATSARWAKRVRELRLLPGPVMPRLTRRSPRPEPPGGALARVTGGLAEPTRGASSAQQGSPQRPSRHGSDVLGEI